MPQLPSFLVIGAAKSGTSSIHEYLRQHPLVSLPKRKESHFFVCDEATNPGSIAYEGRVPKNPVHNLHDYMAEFEEKETATIFGEVCPSYLFFPNAPSSIKHYVPGVRIICILRNPVDRLFSNFNFIREENTIEKFSKLVDSLPSRSNENADFYRWYLEGLYFEQLSRYYSTFPSGNIKIFLYEELKNNPDGLMDDLSDFIGLPPFNFNTSLRFNTSGKARFKWLKRQIKKSKVVPFLRNVLPVGMYQNLRNLGEKVLFEKNEGIPITIRHKLQEIYRPDLEKLQQLINKDVSAWLS